MRSRRTAVHLVTVLEEMSVQETLDGITELRRAGLPVGHVLVNLVRGSPLDDSARTALGAGSVAALTVEAALHKAGIDATPQLVAQLMAEGEDHLGRLQLQSAQRQALLGVDAPVIELPFVAHGVDLGALHDLAEALTEQGLW